MNGAEIRAARERRGWSQAQLADAVDVSPRSVGNWERGESVPKNRAARLRMVLNPEPGTGNPLDAYSTAELLAEVAHRVARLEAAARDGDPPTGASRRSWNPTPRRTQHR